LTPNHDFILGRLQQQFEGHGADDRALRRDARYIGTAWAHCRHPVGRGFRLPSLAGGYWRGMVGSEGEFFMLGFIAGPAELYTDEFGRLRLGWRT
jgi:hypothetical protein